MEQEEEKKSVYKPQNFPTKPTIHHNHDKPFHQSYKSIVFFPSATG